MFSQKRHQKMTKVISAFINYETLNNGFISTKRLHFKILQFFNVSIGLTRIKTERKSLSNKAYDY